MQRVCVFTFHSLSVSLPLLLLMCYCVTLENDAIVNALPLLFNVAVFFSFFFFLRVSPERPCLESPHLTFLCHRPSSLVLSLRCSFQC